MWAQYLVIEEPNLLAVVSDGQQHQSQLNLDDLLVAQSELGASDFFMDQDAVETFMKNINTGEIQHAHQVELGKRIDATANVELQKNELLAILHITGAYGGKPLSPVTIMKALSDAKVTKGINKLALKKALSLGQKLSPGETLSQPIAQGKQPVAGRDAKFASAVKDFRQRVLAPKIESGSKTGKMDMRNLGSQITVSPGDVLMKRFSATPGLPGFTVTGVMLDAKPGKDIPYGCYPGTKVSQKNPEYLIAIRNGLPKVRKDGVEIDEALILPNVSIATGHIGFKGDVVIEGDIEPGMVVKATGDIQVSGFVESSTVQAHGNVTVVKGIIGQVSGADGESNCQVSAKGTITAGYALNASLNSSANIELALHAVNCKLQAKQDLVVLNEGKSNGLISGGSIHVGGKLLCSQLGSEGDAPTEVHMFGSIQKYLTEFESAKALYKQAQDDTMQVVRKELELKKIPKSKRTQEDEDKFNQFKQSSQEKLAKALANKDKLEQTINERLEKCKVEVLHKVYTHVTIHYGEESVTTRNEHEYSLFSFDKYKIDRQSIKPEE